MKRKVKVKSLPKAQTGKQAPMILNSAMKNNFYSQQNPWGNFPGLTGNFNVGMPTFEVNTSPSFYADVYQGDPNTTGSFNVGMPEFNQEVSFPSSLYPTKNNPLSLYPRNTKLDSGILSTNEAIRKSYTDQIPEDTRKLMGLEPFGDLKTKKVDQKGTNPYIGPMLLAGTDVFSSVARKLQDRNRESDFRNQFLSDNLYNVRPEDYQGNRGDYLTNTAGLGPDFRPDDYIYGDYNKIAQMGGEMKRKVRITSLPQAEYGGTQNAKAVNQLYGNSAYMMNMFNGATKGEPDTVINQTMKAAPRETAVLEAEGGETIVRPGQDGIPQLYTISGPDHNPDPNAQGGVPLDGTQAPEGSFIFTKQKSMKIKNLDAQESLGLTPNKKGYIIADVSKKFNLNDPTYRKILDDPKSDPIARATAERMLDNYTSKLGQLALIQEEMKGFPQGIPSIAHPYLKKIGVNPEDMMPVNATEGMQTAMYGGVPKAQSGFNLGNPSGAFNQFLPSVQQPVRSAPAARTQSRPAQARPASAAPQEYSVLSEIQNYNPAIGDNLLKGQYGDFTTDYELLQQSLNTPEVKEKLLADYNAIHPKNKFTGTSDEFVKNYLDNQLHAYALTANYPSDILNSEDWDRVKKFGKENVIYDAAIKKLGLNPLGKDEISKWQSGFRILGKLSLDPDSKISTPLRQFKWSPEGVTDEPDYLRRADVSLEDAIFGNTSNRQIARLRERPVPEKGKDKDNYYQEDIQGVEMSKKGPDFYIQDVMNTGLGLANRLNINKYNPTLSQYEPELMKPTYYDPNRELANNAEMVNIAAQNLAQFTGPQAFNARFSDVQGKGLANAANIQSKYNNLNVGVANQFEQANKQLSNQAKLSNINSFQNYLAGVATANQQYDNAVNQANTNLVQSGLVPAFTNRAKTQVMNSLISDYMIDPTTGGMLNFTPSGRQFNGQSTQTGKPGMASFISEMEKEDPYFRSLSTKDKYDIAMKMNQGSRKTKRDTDREMLAKYFGFNDN
jgi:hypothetical protein